jgi:hypothetical protein
MLTHTDPLIMWSRAGAEGVFPQTGCYLDEPTYCVRPDGESMCGHFVDLVGPYVYCQLALRPQAVQRD